MAEVTNELIYEVLKSVQSPIGNLEEEVREIKTELRAVKGHLHAIQIDVENLYQSVATVDLRVQRIERRLELSDAAV